jgi:glycosyltransferase involved in cell wall biosynthesis
MVIDSLEAGGAETMFVDILPRLADAFELHLVTCRDQNDFETDIYRHFTSVYNLDYSGNLSLRHLGSLRIAVRKLKTRIIEVQPDLVHGQLFVSTVLSRFACPSSIPLVFTVHFTMDVFYQRKYLSLLMWEKVSYKKYHHMIGVAAEVISTFKRIHPAHERSFLLYNYVKDPFFENQVDIAYRPGTKLKLVAVNNLRPIKNVPFLLDVMQSLKSLDIELDIYGAGTSFAEIRDRINREGISNVRLMGQHFDLEKKLKQYHLFVSASVHEGFGIAVAEAMSMGLPVLISNLPVYKEVAGELALYFDPAIQEELRDRLIQVYEGGTDLLERSKTSALYAASRFRKGNYTDGLISIYHKCMTA